MREQDLRKKIEIETTKNAVARQQLEGRVEDPSPHYQQTTKSLETKLQKLELQTNKLSHELCERNRELAAARNILKVRDEEIADLRRLLASHDRRLNTAIVPAQEDVHPAIDGMQFLYVGGRPQTKIRIQNLFRNRAQNLSVMMAGRPRQASVRSRP